MKRTRLLYGVGINDADYELYKYGIKDGERKVIWRSPIYTSWCNMLKRCYSLNYHKIRPTYPGCSVVKEWLRFMTYHSWMIKQDWEGKQLDKDLLIPGNKVYGPKTCVFISQAVNSFLTERQNDRGEWPIGVCFNKPWGKFTAYCRNVKTGKKQYLGRFDTAEEAHKAWIDFKVEQANFLADQEIDERVVIALKNRYTSLIDQEV